MGIPQVVQHFVFTPVHQKSKINEMTNAECHVPENADVHFTYGSMGVRKDLVLVNTVAYVYEIHNGYAISKTYRIPFFF